MVESTSAEEVLQLLKKEMWNTLVDSVASKGQSETKFVAMGVL